MAWGASVPERNERAGFGGKDWAPSLIGVILFGLLVVLGYTGMAPASLIPAGGVATGLLFAGAALLVGILVGFLFGIPRSVQSDGGQPTASGAAGGGAQPPASGAAAEGAREPAKPRAPNQYGTNTNLEQISDWLTKILVGVGLTQISEIQDKLWKLSQLYGKSLGGGELGPPIALAIMVYFSVSGFLFGYLWTRLRLKGELTEAELGELAKAEVTAAIGEQSRIDATALSLGTQYLNPAADVSKISVEELKKAIAESSSTTKVQLFYQAQDLRQESWKQADKKPNVERTIPIFEALIAADKQKGFHKNFAQLGFALKDKPNPDYRGALNALDAAIKARGPADKQGSEIYEFNRAVCRIRLDADFAAGRVSSAEQQKAIVDDLIVAKRGVPHLLLEESAIVNWLKINNQQLP